jgi:hypothetical protein
MIKWNKKINSVGSKEMDDEHKYYLNFLMRYIIKS